MNEIFDSNGNITEYGHLVTLGAIVRQDARYLMNLRQNQNPDGSTSYPVDFDVGEPIAGEEVRIVLGGYVHGVFNGRRGVWREMIVERVYPA